MTKQVRYDDVSLVYPGGTKPAVSHLNLDIAEGEFLVLVGPSGCGKSTSLRMLAGLEPISAGTIFIGDRDVTHVPGQGPRHRDGVPELRPLPPHVASAENMAFALKIQKVSKEEITRRVKEAAALLDLTEYLERKPKALSGGQRQRVAMGRAIVREPEVFLMDEPLSNLDAKLRVQTRTQIAALQRRLGTTTLYVTHDQVEAMTMGDRVAVLKDGILQQCASPRELYDNPANAFVGTFIGSPSMNIIPSLVAEGGIDMNGYLVPVERDVLAKASCGKVIVGVRPEDLALSDRGCRHDRHPGRGARRRHLRLRHLRRPRRPASTSSPAARAWPPRRSAPPSRSSRSARTSSTPRAISSACRRLAQHRRGLASDSGLDPGTGAGRQGDPRALVRDRRVAGHQQRGPRPGCRGSRRRS